MLPNRIGGNGLKAIQHDACGFVAHLVEAFAGRFFQDELHLTMFANSEQTVKKEGGGSGFST